MRTDRHAGGGRQWSPWTLAAVGLFGTAALYVIFTESALRLRDRGVISDETYQAVYGPVYRLENETPLRSVIRWFDESWPFRG